MSVRDVNSAAQIAARIAKGWKPNRYLTNMSMAYFSYLPGRFFHRLLL